MIRVLMTVMAVLTAASIAAKAQDPSPDQQQDEFLTVVEEMEASYADEDYGDVKEDLDYLQQIVAQKRLALLATFLPEPLDGWTAADIQNTNAGAFGGGLNASRQYSMDSQQVTISIVVDSPVLNQLGALMTNPSFAQASGATLIRINGEQFIAQEGNLRAPLGAKLLTLEGSATQDQKVAYAETLDLEGIEDFE